jgi:lipopolysaccharide export system protein LptA
VGGNVVMGTGKGLSTGTTDGDIAYLQAYDVDGAAYTTFATLTAGNTPTMNLSSDVTVGTGNKAIVIDGGNTLGAALSVGTADANTLNLVTGIDATTRLSIDSSGAVTINAPAAGSALLITGGAGSTAVGIDSTGTAQKALVLQSDALVDALYIDSGNLTVQAGDLNVNGGTANLQAVIAAGLVTAQAGLEAQGAVSTVTYDGNGTALTVSNTAAAGDATAIALAVNGSGSATAATVSAGTGQTALSVTADAGQDAIVLPTGDLTVSAGDVKVTAGDLTVNAGDVHITAGKLDMGTSYAITNTLGGAIAVAGTSSDSIAITIGVNTYYIPLYLAA